MGIDGLDERAQRHQDARVPHCPWRGRRGGTSRPAATVGPGRAGLSGRHAGRPGGRSARRCATRSGCAPSVSPARRSSATPASRSRSRGRPGSGGSTPRRRRRASPAAPRCSPRSTGWSTIGSAPSSCSTSSTSSRCTSRRTSDGGGTSPCRCCTTIGSSARSTPSPTARQRELLVHAVHRDVPFSRTVTAAVRAELDALGRWLRLDVVHDA